MRKRFEDFLNALLVLAALAIAAASIHRELTRKRSITIDARTRLPPTLVPNWTSLLPSAILVGDSAAKVKIVEFVDFECPACRGFHLVLSAVRRAYGDQVAAHYLHYPLSYHRFAMPAARAAMCAHSVGAFEAFQDVVFRKQDSLGLKSWGSFAREAGVLDTTALVRCASATGSIPAIETGLALGREYGVEATPTVLINGWRFMSAPRDSATLGAVIDRLLMGHAPTPVPRE